MYKETKNEIKNNAAETSAEAAAKGAAETNIAVLIPCTSCTTRPGTRQHSSLEQV